MDFSDAFSNAFQFLNLIRYNTKTALCGFFFSSCVCMWMSPEWSKKRKQQKKKQHCLRSQDKGISICDNNNSHDTQLKTWIISTFTQYSSLNLKWIAFQLYLFMWMCVFRCVCVYVCAPFDQSINAKFLFFRISI